ncbi:DUF2135 domain-containing protein [Azoarcus sp. TTM-91]|uniref:YfaP family protein n=1 Tax=Azoarcus sp. TTM-91 TaxID=2691581 RepID=UPI00145CB721|nr:DUF2135 domain-containing protein [Azoarcus sp. TTM-91]NMG32898.1 DUF2135 domain-containing protein [Azoarcus sp. TTM-91]
MRFRFRPDFLFAAALSLVPLPALALQPLTLDAPAGGWNRGGFTDRSEDSGVAYPYSPIDRGAQAGRTLIRGRLAAEHRARDANGKVRMPPTLVVNGNPMPLYSDNDGRFARPYAFAPGSNSVEIRSAGGESLGRLQFYEANPARPRAQLRAILAWDDDQAEVDLHVLTPDGQHAFWAHPQLSNGGGMDVDSVDGAGPEMFSMTAPLRGPYQLYVNYWGNFGSAGYHFDESTRQRKIITCRITLVFHENTPQERRESFVVPLRKIGDLTHVKTVIF